MTKVVNKYAIATGAGIMILAVFFPYIGTLLATLPSAVLGGCTIMMFSTIVISGVQMIGKCGFSQRNITIVALSLSVGLGFTQCPEIFDIFPTLVKTVFAENCVALVFVTAIVLTLSFLKRWNNSNLIFYITLKAFSLRMPFLCGKLFILYNLTFTVRSC